jgi:signal transduction histidine kinase
MSIRFKVVFVVIVVMTLVFGFLLVVVAWNTRRHQRDLEDRMRRALTPIIQGLVRREGWDTNRTLSELGYKITDAVDYNLIQRYAIIGLEGECISSNIPEADLDTFIRDDAVLARALRQNRVLLYPEQNFIAVPFSVRQQSAGVIKLEVNAGSQPSLREAALEAFMPLFAIIAFFTIVLISATYLLLNNLVLKPLVSLVSASRRVAEGDYSVRVEPGKKHDEMKDLIDAFNAMTSDIRDYHFNLERKVEEATSRFKDAQRSLVIAQRLAATGTLAAGIAHEVNNPLGGMINAARRLRKDAGENERVDQYLGLIEEGLERVQATVAKILSFMPREIQPQPVVFRDITQKAVDLTAHKIRRKGITIRNELDEDMPAVFGDPSELQQVMLNLIMNAVDAIDEEGGLITVSGSLTETVIKIRIEDTGCGMEEDQVAKAFDLFYTTKETGTGTGLGISIVHNIIQNHHGRMSIQSEKGKGTTVELEFPIMRDLESGRYKLVDAPQPPQTP